VWYNIDIGGGKIPQIYMIITPRAKDVIMDKISLLDQKLTLAIEKGFDIEGEDDVAFTTPEVTLYTRGEADVQVEVRYTAGEDEYDRGKLFDPSIKEQEELCVQIWLAFGKFLADQELEPLSLSVWCKPSYKSVFKLFP